MTEIEQKALALVNEFVAEKAMNNTPYTRLPTVVNNLVLLRAIEQHEAFRQDVSDAVVEYFGPKHFDVILARHKLSRFIIPKPKLDPLVEVMKELVLTARMTSGDLRAALEARGLEIREKGA